MKWDTVEIETPSGVINAVAPIIISASRATDIPAFYSQWFMKRLNDGYVRWINPFNQKSQYISFNKTKVVVFWSKNPAPLISYLDQLDDMGISYYFQFTINNYDEDNLEPNVPPLGIRLNTFKMLSTKLGRERIIWRYDPLILTPELTVKQLLHKIKRVGEALHPYTEKLVFSFADISAYKKVLRKLKSAGIDFLDFSNQTMCEIAEGISQLNRNWNLKIATCAERINLHEFGIEHNKCIDDELIIKITKQDKQLLRFLGRDASEQMSIFDNSIAPIPNIKDRGQRLECGCIISKDIGHYNTCPHLCRYCYANISEKVVMRNYNSFDMSNDAIVS